MATKAAVEELHNISTVVDSKEAIAQVAAVSSGSEKVGHLIADAMEKSVMMVLLLLKNQKESKPN